MKTFLWVFLQQSEVISEILFQQGKWASISSHYNFNFIMKKGTTFKYPVLVMPKA